MSFATPNAYLRDAVMTASPEQLHLMLYDGAIRFALQAKDALAARNYEASYNKLSRAQAIILEMQNGLRPEVNPELCERMAAIYMFLYRKLVDASVKRDTGCIDDVLQVLHYQRETWVMLIDQVAKERAEDHDAPQAARGAPFALVSDEPAALVGGALCVEG